MERSNVGTLIYTTQQLFQSRVNRNSLQPLFVLPHTAAVQSAPLLAAHPSTSCCKTISNLNANSGLFIQLHHWCASPHSSISPPFPRLSSDPISQWSHQKLIPISALDGGPQQCAARLNSAVNSQPFPQRPAHPCALPTPPPTPLYPNSTAAYFRRVFG